MTLAMGARAVYADATASWAFSVALNNARPASHSRAHLGKEKLMVDQKRFTLLLVACAACLQGQPAENFASGLQFPQRLIFTQAGHLLASEGGTREPNSGRVSIVDRSGTRRSLLEGLPSGPAHFTNPFGPTGMAHDGRTLYLLIGKGDIMAGVPPNYGINLNGPSSPIFSSLLRIQFSRDPDEIVDVFHLEPVHHWALLDGDEVTLTNTAGDRARISVLTAFRPMVRNVLGGDEPVRPSDPYSLVADANKHFLYVVDASAETVSRVDTRAGRYLTLYRFLPAVRDTPPGRRQSITCRPPCAGPGTGC